MKVQVHRLEASSGGDLSKQWPKIEQQLKAAGVDAKKTGIRVSDQTRLREGPPAPVRVVCTWKRFECLWLTTQIHARFSNRGRPRVVAGLEVGYDIFVKVFLVGASDEVYLGYGSFMTSAVPVNEVLAAAHRSPESA